MREYTKRKNARTALITGASSGIGEAFAKRLAKDHYHLVLIARNAAALNQLADTLKKEYPINTLVIVKDLTTESAVDEIITELNQQNIVIDMLINNAGYGATGLFAGSNLDRQLGMVELNIDAVLKLTYHLIPTMLARHQGHIVILSSTAAYQPGPRMAVYFATKSFLLSFGEALQYELRDTGIKVTTVCPGATTTNFFQTAGLTETPLSEGKFGMMSSEKVVEQAYKGIKKGKRVVIPGFWFKLFAFISRLTPNRLTFPVTAYIQKKR